MVGGDDGPAVHLADGVLIILEYAAELDLVAVGGPHRDLHQAGGDVVVGIADFGAIAVPVIALGAIDRAAEHVDGRIDADAAEHRGQAAIAVGAVRAADIDAPALTGPQHVLNILGTERSDAADRAGAVDVRRRSTDHVDAADQFGIEEERAVGVVARALVVLPGAVDDHGDAAEILQAANIDGGRGIVAAVLHPHAGHIVKQVAEAIGLLPLDLLLRHHADRSQRIDRALLGLRGRHGNLVQRLRRAWHLCLGVESRRR